MGNLIAILPDSIANQIAAGEVIQRPASVVKELLENAVDAGADLIDLIVKDSGRTLIQVIDNGRGMNPLDARMCWERHATSKIRKAEDLFQIRSFGFRGEALASIASVAQVEMKTCLEHDEVGTHILIEGSEVKKQGSCVAQRGTNISVRNLFYNIPARRNFLKSNAVEFRHIVDEFIRVALPNEHCAFRLIHNDHCHYDLKPGDRARRIAEILGVSQDQLFYGEELSPAADYRLYLGAPEIAKRTRGDQYFIVNGRFIKDPYLNHAIQQEYKNYLPEEHHGTYVAFLDLDPARIDINVHPTKTEIKFEDERTLYALLKSVVKKVLAGHHLGSSGQELFDDTSFQHLLHSGNEGPEFPHPPKLQVNPGYNPFQDEPVRQKKNLGRWQDLFEGMDRKTDQNRPEDLRFQTLESAGPMADLSFGKVIQVFNSYLLVPTPEQLLVVDQEMAHQRVLFERLMQNIRDQRSTSQQLLFPRVVEFQPGDAALVSDILEEIRHLGFDISEFGKNTFIINGLPAVADKTEAQSLLEGLLEEYKASARVDLSDKQEHLARALARKSAVKKGTKLTDTEVQQLIQDLLACREPALSPGAKPVFVRLDEKSLTQLFTR